MGKKTALVISVIFHPLLMPTILFTIIYLFAPFLLAPFNNGYFLLIVLIASFLIPLISIVTLYKTGTIDTFVMNEKGERALPFAFIAVFYWIISYMFYNQFKPSSTILVLFLTISSIISLVAIINFFWKISAHSIGISGIIGFLICLNIKFPEVDLLYPIAGAIVVAGLVMSARLSLQVHNLTQIWIGSLTGLIISFASSFFLL